MSIEKIIKGLSSVKGISNVRVLSGKEKKQLLKLEERNNIGAICVLEGRHTLVLSEHYFKPPKNLVVRKKGRVVFPPMEFPFIKDAVSALPGFEVHRHLAETMALGKDDVTVLVGLRGELKEVSDAVKKASKTDTIADSVEEPVFLSENKKSDLMVVYANPLPELKVNYAELFSYLHTRPTKISYDYEFSGKSDKDNSEVLNYEVLARINKVRRMEKIVYAGERSDYIPDNVNATEIEHFNVYRRLSFGFALNQVLYHLSLS